jgi:HEAT repeats
MQERIDELIRKNRKLLYRLGEKIYNLHTDQSVRFLYTSDGVSNETDVTKLLRLIEYMTDRISKFEGIASEEVEIKEEVVEEVMEPEVIEEVPSEETKEEVIEEEPEEEIAGEVTEEEPEEEIADEVIEEEPEEPLVIDPTPETSNFTEPSKIVASVENYPKDEEFIDTIFAGAQCDSEADKRLLKKILKELASPEADVRIRCVRNGGHMIDGPEVMKLYECAMDDVDMGVRLAAVKSFAQGKDKKYEGLYRRALQDTESKVRIAAIKGLSILMMEDALDLIGPLLKDDDAYIRGMAATCIGIYCGVPGIKMVIESLSDESAYVRKCIVDMLGVVKPPETVYILEKLAEDQDEEVKKAADAALMKFIIRPPKKARPAAKKIKATVKPVKKVSKPVKGKKKPGKKTKKVSKKIKKTGVAKNGKKKK